MFGASFPVPTSDGQSVGATASGTTAENRCMSTLAVARTIVRISTDTANIAVTAIRSTIRCLTFRLFIACSSSNLSPKCIERMRQPNFTGTAVLFRLFHAAWQALTPYRMDLSLLHDRLGEPTNASDTAARPRKRGSQEQHERLSR